MKLYAAAMSCLALASCVIDETEDLSETSGDITSTNKLATNKLATNKLATNKLAAQKLAANGFTNSSLIETADGRDVLSYILRCGLSATQSLTITASTGTPYKFSGEIGLAPAWTTRALTTSEQRWVSACVLARVNYYGVQVDLSLRGDNPVLAATSAEQLQYSAPEAAFYGNLFIANQPEFACVSLLKALGVGSPSYALRQCAVPSGDGVTTMCGFTYTGDCGLATLSLAPACDTLTTPWLNCHPPRKLLSLGATDTYHETITVELPNALMPAN